MEAIRIKDMWKKLMCVSVIFLLMFIPVSEISAENEQNQAERDWMTNEEFLQKLDEIEKSSSGRVEVDVAGHSSQGTEIISARVGTGDQVLLINGSIHGNEKSGGEALVEIFDFLGTSDSSFAQSVRDEITLVAVPRLNVDGLEIPQRQNIFPWDEVVATYPHLDGADPAWNYNENNRGFDINRDFNADLDYEVVAEDLPGNTLEFGFFITKEAQLLRDLYVDLQNEFGEVEAFVDLHHMGTPVTNKTGEEVTIAIDYPPLGPDDSSKYDDYPKLDQDKSKRYSLAAALGVMERSDNEEPGVSQYIHFQERDYPGQARSAFALNGTATVLFEMPGQQPQVGYDQELIDRVENGLWGIISHMADGSIDDLNGDDFLELPRYWTDSVTDMRDVLERFTEEGQFENTSDARLLDNQLTALENYEKEENSEKMVKHLQAFKVVLDDQLEKELIEREAYNRLNNDTSTLLDRWN